MDEEIKDALGELINIAFGSSTALIADLFDSFATLSVPDIQLIPINEIEPIVLEDPAYRETYVTGQQFKGSFGGEIVFAIDKKSAINIQQMIYSSEEFDDSHAYSEDEIGYSILEISNIIGSSCVGKLLELLKEDVIFSPPSIELAQHLLPGLDKDRFSKVIIIRTLLEFKEVKIIGRLFILFNKEMFAKLEKALEAFVEEL